MIILGGGSSGDTTPFPLVPLPLELLKSNPLENKLGLLAAAKSVKEGDNSGILYLLPLGDNGSRGGKVVEAVEVGEVGVEADPEASFSKNSIQSVENVSLSPKASAVDFPFPLLECPLVGLELPWEVFTPGALNPVVFCNPTVSLCSSVQDKIELINCNISNLLVSALGVFKNVIKTFETSRLDQRIEVRHWTRMEGKL